MLLDRGGRKTSELPPELARLDGELRGIAIEERSSFAAELRATLEEEHRRAACRMGPSATRLRWSGPRLTVAAVAGVLFLIAASVAAPSARASLAELLGRPRTSDSGAGRVESQLRPPAAPTEPGEAEGGGEAPEFPPRPVHADPPDVPVRPPATLPGLLDPNSARRAVAARYPDFLQEAGIGGTVRVLAWVDADGTAEHLQVGESSGVAALDRAALDAAGTFRFRPAMRGPRAVGTWMEFSIRFRPSAHAEDQPDPEYQAPRIPLGY